MNKDQVTGKIDQAVGRVSKASEKPSATMNGQQGSHRPGEGCGKESWGECEGCGAGGQESRKGDRREKSRPDPRQDEPVHRRRQEQAERQDRGI